MDRQQEEHPEVEAGAEVDVEEVEVERDPSVLLLLRRTSMRRWRTTRRTLLLLKFAHRKAGSALYSIARGLQ